MQQILFYRELDLPLKEISEIINKPDFKLLDALELHKKALEDKKEKMDIMLNTIEKTIFNLKNNMEMKHEELYEGISKEQATAYRNEAIEKWGKETIEKSEEQLHKLSKSEMEKLKTDFMSVNNELSKCVNQNPENTEIQTLISKHYQFICQFWGSKPSKEAYIGLGEMYITDDRYTTINNKPNPEFAKFMLKAMEIYANNNLI